MLVSLFNFYQASDTPGLQSLKI
ncbi:Protein of unknown function [Pyronema omphalodes CBS 100304]|uniref:Uncharacterized protein n=1 Tax=Pyronema omphalodes (strain CBS 100304) TaxID=1076935 RepID=U4LN16_PYROM|nr:Protein of unknown function [Pyronema omphalodes CBS 100304]